MEKITPTPGQVTDRLVYEPLLGGVTVPNQYAAAPYRAILAYADSIGPEERARAIRRVMDRRRSRLNYLTVTQRSWQTKVSRRPQRGRHHDSWSIREKYVRCTG